MCELTAAWVPAPVWRWGGGCSRRGGRLPHDCTLNSNTHCAQTCRDNSTLLQKITRCHTHVRVSRHTLGLSVHITIKMQDSAAEMWRPALTSDTTRNPGRSVRNVMVCICMSPPPSACLLRPFGGSGVATTAALCPEQTRCQGWFLR